MVTQEMRADSAFEAEKLAVQTAATQQGRRFDDMAAEEMAARLYVVRSRVIDVTPPLTELQKLVPVFAEIGNWADALVLSSGFTVGEPKIISDKSDDLPTVDRGRNFEGARSHLLGASYEYTVPELEYAGFTNSELPTDKAIYVRQEMDRKIAQYGIEGDPRYGMKGLLTYPWTTVEDTVTAQTALVKITSFINQHWNLKGGVFPVTHVVLPQTIYDDVSITPSNPNTNLTVLGALQAANPGITFLKAAELNTAGKNKKGSIIVGTIRSDILRNRVPVAFRMLPSQARNLSLYTPCFCKVAGLEVMQKDAVLRVDLK